MIQSSGTTDSAPPADDRRALLAVGVCGGLTTFSTFSWETVSLIETHAYGLAAAYVGTSLPMGMLAVVFGLWAGARLAQ